MIYVSAPLSNAKDTELRLKQIREYSSSLFLINKHVICPTTLGEAFCGVYPEIKERDSYFWLIWYEKFFPIVKEMNVLMFDGWRESIGVNNEINLAKNYGIKINYINVKQLNYE